MGLAGLFFQTLAVHEFDTPTRIADWTCRLQRLPWALDSFETAIKAFYLIDKSHFADLSTMRYSKHRQFWFVTNGILTERFTLIKNEEYSLGHLQMITFS